MFFDWHLQGFHVRGDIAFRRAKQIKNEPKTKILKRSAGTWAPAAEITTRTRTIAGTAAHVQRTTSVLESRFYLFLRLNGRHAFRQSEQYWIWLRLLTGVHMLIRDVFWRRGKSASTFTPGLPREGKCAPYQKECGIGTNTILLNLGGSGTICTVVAVLSRAGSSINRRHDFVT
jgi:hypothetical protein